MRQLHGAIGSGFIALLFLSLISNLRYNRISVQVQVDPVFPTTLRARVETEVESPLPSAGLDDRTSDALPPPPSGNDTEPFSACLMFMDDKHFLPEWLAYHYQYLPLRRLIIAVDPKSQTSPDDILDRFHSRGLINITRWHDEDFYDKIEKVKRVMEERFKNDTDKVLENVFLIRQKKFYAHCMRKLKSEGFTWTAFVDTDEFIARNLFAKEKYELPNKRSTMMGILNYPSNRAISRRISENSTCISMNRLQFGTKEMESPSNYTVSVQNQLDWAINSSISVAKDLLTYRWRYHEFRPRSLMLPRKCVVDVSRIEAKRMVDKNSQIHAPMKPDCLKIDRYVHFKESIFVVHSYAGTFEQFTYRDDSRNKRTRAMYDRIPSFQGPDNDPEFYGWLPGLVSTLGADTVSDLLQGSGQLEKVGRYASAVV